MRYFLVLLLGITAVLGGSYRFDGVAASSASISSSFVSIPLTGSDINFAKGTSWTVEMFIKPDALQLGEFDDALCIQDNGAYNLLGNTGQKGNVILDRTIASNQASNFGGYSIGVYTDSNTKVLAFSGGTITGINGGATVCDKDSTGGIFITDGRWHHVAFQFDATSEQLCVFRNGRKIDCQDQITGANDFSWQEGQDCTDNNVDCEGATMLDPFIWLGTSRNPSLGAEYTGLLTELSFWTVGKYDVDGETYTLPQARYVGTEADLAALYHLNTAALDGEDSVGGNDADAVGSSVTYSTDEPTFPFEEPSTPIPTPMPTPMTTGVATTGPATSGQATTGVATTGFATTAATTSTPTPGPRPTPIPTLVPDESSLATTQRTALFVVTLLFVAFLAS